MMSAENLTGWRWSQDEFRWSGSSLVGRTTAGSNPAPVAIFVNRNATRGQGDRNSTAPGEYRAGRRSAIHCGVEQRAIENANVPSAPRYGAHFLPATGSTEGRAQSADGNITRKPDSVRKPVSRYQSRPGCGNFRKGGDRTSNGINSSRQWRTIMRAVATSPVKSAALPTNRS